MRSSLFKLAITLDLTNGETISFDAHGGTGETGRIDYFDNAAVVTVSPKQLGNAKDVDELVKLLEEGVRDGWSGKKIFDKSCPVESDCCFDELAYYLDLDGDDEDEYQDLIFDAYDFITEIREKITDMDQIEEISIYAEEDFGDEPFVRNYVYNLSTKEYTGTEEGQQIIGDGNSGDLQLDDLGSCDIDTDD